MTLPRRRRGRASFALLLLLAALAALLVPASSAPVVESAPAAAAAGPTTVVLRNIAFKPSTVRIPRGRSVRWVWDDPFVRHNVRSSGRPRFTGVTSRMTGSATRRFMRAGTYRYVCTLHPGMKGTVVVR